MKTLTFALLTLEQVFKDMDKDLAQAIRQMKKEGA